MFYFIFFPLRGWLAGSGPLMENSINLFFSSLKPSLTELFIINYCYWANTKTFFHTFISFYFILVAPLRITSYGVQLMGAWHACTREVSAAMYSQDGDEKLFWFKSCFSSFYLVNLLPYSLERKSSNIWGVRSFHIRIQHPWTLYCCYCGKYFSARLQG